LRRTLILVTILALGGLAQAQGFLSRLSLAAGGEGIVPASTSIKDANGLNSTTQTTKKSLGAIVSARIGFGNHSAFDFSVTANRSSETSSKIVSGVPSLPDYVKSNNLEFIGSYVFRLPSTDRFHPYFLVGGGMVRFSPIDNGFTTSVVPQTQTKGAFAYGFGADVDFNDSWSLRLQYRGLVRGDPDFGLQTSTIAPFGTGSKTHVVEPSIQVVYHF
jgi:opacity protein-like surface antigen